MIEFEQYFSQTEHATRKLFDCISEYKEMIRNSIPPCEAFDYDGKDVTQSAKYLEWRNKPEIIEQHRQADEARKNFRAQIFSMHVISGSIVQIACKAIELYSTNDFVDSKYEFLFDQCKASVKIQKAKFCIGREVRNVPIGFIILAARNQYNHIEAGSNLDQLNKNIFNSISKKQQYIDPAFDLDERGIINYSSNMRALIEWDTYEKYKTDMLSILPTKI